MKANHDARTTNLMEELTNYSKLLEETSKGNTYRLCVCVCV